MSHSPRALHPIAWWLWTICLLAAVTRTTNPLLLALVLAVLGLVIASRRTAAPWARAFRYYLTVALVIIGIRIVFRSVFATGVSTSDHILFTLPQLHTPHWYSGITLGGPVSVEATLAACFDGLRLGTLLCCVGAANVLANPKRALRVLPGALYELGVAIVVALTIAPQLVESVQRVRRARRLRAGGGRGVRRLRAVAVPVLEDALERSLRLAAGMDSRGYGRTGLVGSRTRRATAALLLAGMSGLCIGLFGLLDASAPRALGLPALLGGAVLCCTGLAVGGRRVHRTAYRPDPWRAPEWIVVAGGVVCTVTMLCGMGFDAGALNPTLHPLAWPSLPLVPAAGILIAGLAALAAPMPGDSRPALVGSRSPGAAGSRAGVIDFDRVTLTYLPGGHPVLRDVTLHVDEGELCLVVGRTGSGKSSLLGAVNGLVPHFTGGTVAGDVRVDGRSTAHYPPRELADVVGVVGQDPLAGFVTDTVEEELAFGMEQLAIAPATMRKRVEETLDLLGLADLRSAALHELSGGQQQRVAIGSVLTTHPRVLVLDEPTSALDPTAAEDVLAAITRLVHDLGITVLLAEHRLERVVQYADRVIHLPGDGTAIGGAPDAIFERTAVAPPVVELGRLARWTPLPLSVRDARRRVSPLRASIAALAVPAARAPVGDGRVVLRATGVVVRYGSVVAVDGIDLDLRAGEVTALMGRNGSGKSSLLWALQGSGPRQHGSVAVDGRDPKAVSPADARGLVGLVPQTPADLLYLDTVRAELEQADRESGPGESARVLLDRIVPGVADDIHPRDLSEGQRLGLVLAIQLRATPEVLLLDEPTRGLDYPAKRALIGIVDDLAAQGRTVLISTHDVEFVAPAADRVVVLAEGEVVADGPTAEVIVASPAFAPQTSKILAPLPYLTPAQVATALAGAAS